MENQPPNLAPEMIEDLCRRYREAEQAKALHFERCEVRLTATNAAKERTVPGKTKE